MAGKGDRPRPFSVTSNEFADRWQQTFGRTKPRRFRRHVVEVKSGGVVFFREEREEEIPDDDATVGH